MSGDVVRVFGFAVACARCPALSTTSDTQAAARIQALAEGWVRRFRAGWCCKSCALLKKERK